MEMAAVYVPLQLNAVYFRSPFFPSKWELILLQLQKKTWPKSADLYPELAVKIWTEHHLNAVGQLMFVSLWMSDEKQWKCSIAAEVYLNISRRCRSVAQEADFPAGNTTEQKHE